MAPYINGSKAIMENNLVLDLGAGIGLKVLIQRFTEALGRDVYLRAEGSDQQIWIDAFDFAYHVPPVEIEPDAVLDLGANIGLTAAHYQAMWLDALVCAVEMDPENFALCRRNFSGLAVNIAVGAVAGETSYKKEGYWQAAHTITQPGEGTTKVETLPNLLSIYLPDAGSIFCKMDIEGAEWGIFANHDWDERIRWLLVEIHGGSLEEAAGLLSGTFTVVPHTVHPLALWAVR